MLFESNNKKIKIFLADVSLEMKKANQIIVSILESAGITVLYNNEEKIETILNQTDCSLHIIGNIFSGETDTQLDAVKSYAQKNEGYKIFIWQPIDRFNISIDDRQEKFITKIRNNIFRNMVYTQHESPVILVEDIRTMMLSETNMDYCIKETDIFLIFNEIDEDAIENISDLIEDIGTVQKMNIILNSNSDYSEIAAQQIAKAKLSIIYFKRASLWALPFTQQIWKKIGGASSKSRILLLGDSIHEQNTKINFKAPNVEFITVSEELIPLEIKVQLDKIENVL